MPHRIPLGYWFPVILLCGLAIYFKPSCDRALEPVDPAWSRMDTLRPDMRCNATWYSHPEHGRPTASGEIFDSTLLTCAIYPGFRKYAPYGSRLLVRNALNGKRVVVRVNDAMPAKWAKQGKMIDLSRAAAESLGVVHQGVATVEAWRVE
jgi:rare lipoprotein A